MKRTIRAGIFETNSSSTHAIVVYNGNEPVFDSVITIDDSIFADDDCYGTEFKTLQEKVAILAKIAYYTQNYGFWDLVLKSLASHNVMLKVIPSSNFANLFDVNSLQMKQLPSSFKEPPYSYCYNGTPEEKTEYDAYAAAIRPLTGFGYVKQELLDEYLLKDPSYIDKFLFDRRSYYVRTHADNLPYYDNYFGDGWTSDGDIDCTDIEDVISFD